jgi:hypothetical protein
MKVLYTLAIVSMTLSSIAMADSGCKPAGCSPDRNRVGGCRPIVKKVDLKKTCYNIETKTICIPPTRFPWEKSPCDTLCGNKCGTNGACEANGKCSSNGHCGSNGICGAGCGTDRSCESGGLFGGLRKALGMDNCPRALCVKSPKKSSKKFGEACVCEWKCDDICPKNSGCRKPGCCNDGTAPPASAPATPKVPEIAPPPPESARRPGRIIQTGFQNLQNLFD